SVGRGSDSYGQLIHIWNDDHAGQHRRAQPASGHYSATPAGTDERDDAVVELEYGNTGCADRRHVGGFDWPGAYVACRRHRIAPVISLADPVTSAECAYCVIGCRVATRRRGPPRRAC